MISGVGGFENGSAIDKGYQKYIIWSTCVDQLWKGRSTPSETTVCLAHIKTVQLEHWLNIYKCRDVQCASTTCDANLYHVPDRSNRERQKNESDFWYDSCV